MLNEVLVVMQRAEAAGSYDPGVGMQRLYQHVQAGPPVDAAQSAEFASRLRQLRDQLRQHPLSCLVQGLYRRATQ